MRSRISRMLKAWWQAFGTRGRGSCLSIVSCAGCAMKEGVNWRYVSLVRTVNAQRT